MKEKIKEALATGFIDKDIVSIKEYRPKLVTNNVKTQTKVRNELVQQLEKCEEFIFSVAFIVQSGIACLKQDLINLEKRGVKGKILTSNYLGFTDPFALKELLQFKNIELKINMENNFHAKGYIFKREQLAVMLVGSSNLTQNALCVNSEWNVKTISHLSGELIAGVEREFKQLWDESEVVTEAFISEYERHYQPQRFVPWQKSQKLIRPNKMQTKALQALHTFRQRNAKGLLISATGTGKTYLTAFDVQRMNPKRMLFIVHREQIIDNTIASFRKIITNKAFGKLSGTSKQYDCEYLFATIQTLVKEYKYFAQDSFAYIVVDEAHNAGSKSYQEVLRYFQAKFTLGLSATPERMDGFNIFDLFDNNLIYEIRLAEALENNLLVPFHYYGITDIEFRGEASNEHVSFNQLVSKERVEHIVNKLELYGHYGEKVKGLIFCSRLAEIKQLAEQFNLRGLKSAYLDGSHSQAYRNQIVEQLEQGELAYIFTVDIFNEGIDIPCLNQIVMLRPTESSIVFLQQLGRGLRKSKDKEYVVVLDFIANYKNNFLIPLALSETTSTDKEGIKKFLINSNYGIFGASTVNFEPIVKERIFQLLDSVKLDSKNNIKQQFLTVYSRLNKVPRLMDLVRFNVIDPQIIFAQYNNYYYFLQQLNLEKRYLAEKACNFLSFIAKQLANGKRKIELDIIKALVKNEPLCANKFAVDEDTYQSALRVLNNNFYLAKTAIKKAYIVPLLKGETISGALRESLTNEVFIEYFNDLLDYYEYNCSQYKQLFERYRKYTRMDVNRLLNWQKELVPLGMAGYRFENGYCPLFVNVNSKNFKNLMYNNQVIKWYFKRGTKLDAKEVNKVKTSTGKVTFLLFMQKGKASDFDFISEVVPDLNSFVEETIEKQTTVSVKMILKEAMRDDIFNYYASQISD